MQIKLLFCIKVIKLICLGLMEQELNETIQADQKLILTTAWSAYADQTAVLYEGNSIDLFGVDGTRINNETIQADPKLFVNRAWSACKDQIAVLYKGNKIDLFRFDGTKINSVLMKVDKHISFAQVGLLSPEVVFVFYGEHESKLCYIDLFRLDGHNICSSLVDVDKDLVLKDAQALPSGEIAVLYESDKTDSFNAFTGEKIGGDASERREQEEEGEVL